jgi:glutamate/tyrosine decarboxylase-like PLP-dependent enzyme
MATKEASPIFSKIETEIIEKLCDVINWPSDSRNGITVPGGSNSNFMAIHCARQSKFPNIKKFGMDGKKIKIFISEDAHYSFEKACIVLGFGIDSLKKIRVDDFGKMDVKHLKEEILNSFKNHETPLCVCATAGTTVFGAFDPLSEIANICRQYNIWFHVDAAWGGPVLFSKNYKHLLHGIHLADSITFDAHKLFGASLTCSFYLTSHKNILQEANDVFGGQYLFHDNSSDIDRGRLSWQCGRRPDFFSFWAIWKSVGSIGLGDFVDKLYKIRDDVIDWIKDNPRIVIIKKPEYLNLCLKIKPPTEEYNESDWSKKVRNFLLEKNISMINYSKSGEDYFLRLIFVNAFLKFEHIESILRQVLDFH